MLIYGKNVSKTKASSGSSQDSVQFVNLGSKHLIHITLLKVDKVNYKVDCPLG